MNKESMILLIIITLVIAIIALLGKGITGNIISESCCFGDDCPNKYRCVEPHVEEPKGIGINNHFVLLFGLIFLLIAIISWAIHQQI